MEKLGIPNEGYQKYKTTIPKRLQQKDRIISCFKLVSCLANFSTMKMEAKYSSKTSVAFQRTTRNYILEDREFSISSDVRTLSYKQSNNLRILK
jgi:hypothetical protein